MNAAELRRALATLARRVRLVASRGVVRQVADGGGLQSVQVSLLDGEVCDRVERFQQFGITARPLAGAEAVYLELNGSRDHGIVIAVEDRRYRVRDLEPGESALYNAGGDIVRLGADGTLRITTRLKVVITAPLVEISGDLHVAGSIVAQGDIADHADKTMAAMRDAYNDHVHGASAGPDPEM